MPPFSELIRQHAWLGRQDFVRLHPALHRHVRGDSGPHRLTSAFCYHLRPTNLGTSGRGGTARRSAEGARQAAILRCVSAISSGRRRSTHIGDPPTPRPRPGLIYEDRAFDRMPLLADALMDAGPAPRRQSSITAAVRARTSAGAGSWTSRWGRSRRLRSPHGEVLDDHKTVGRERFKQDRHRVHEPGPLGRLCARDSPWTGSTASVALMYDTACSIASRRAGSAATYRSARRSVRSPSTRLCITASP